MKRARPKGASALLPPEVQLLLDHDSWRRFDQYSIKLPDGVVIPDGAIQKRSSGRTLLMRSRCETPIAEQVAALTAIVRVVSTQLDEPAEGARYLRSCFELGWLHESSRRTSLCRHPATFVGLAMAGLMVQSRRGALLRDVALEFCKWKQHVLRALQSRFGQAVFIPDFFEQHNFQVESPQECSELLIATNGNKWGQICDFICESLSVTRMPVLYDGTWCIALLPNMVGASDADVASGVATFYELLELHRQQREQQQDSGEELSSDDVANLAAVLRGSRGGERTFINYLAAKWAPRDVRKSLQLTDRRAKSLIGKYDATTQHLRREREAAFLKVAGKTIKRTGQEIKDLNRAAEYEMRRVAQKEKVTRCHLPFRNTDVLLSHLRSALAQLMVEIARRGRKVDGEWKSSEEFQQIVKDVVRGMGEASSKGQTGATPEDADILKKAEKAFGISGGRVDRIHVAVREACLARWGRAPSRSTTHGSFAAACIKFAQNVAEMAPVLQQHYCRARVLFYTWVFLVFSAWSIILSMDQKALYKANCDRSKGYDIQVMSERARWAVTDKGAGYDTLCSIALFSIWQLPWKSLSLESAARSGLGSFISCMKMAIGWTDELYGERPGVAAAFGYVAAGKELNAEDCEPETSARNQGAVDKHCTLFAEYCMGPDGLLVPFILFILDNSKGPADKDFGFCLGLFFFIRNLDVCAAVSPAGKCSYEVPAEKVNGAEAKRLRGTMVRYKAESNDPKGASQETLRTVCERIDGATFNAGGGCVTVEVASDIETAFPWDAVEIKDFLGAGDEGKAKFQSKHERKWPGIADLYRKVFLYQAGASVDGYQLYSHDSGSCIWRKREGCTAHESWRGPMAMRLLLNLWPGGIPPSIVPSVERPGSYARPAERFNLRERYAEVQVETKADGSVAKVVVPKPTVQADAFNPRRICDKA